MGDLTGQFSRFPPELLASADQAFADANIGLDLMLRDLREIFYSSGLNESEAFAMAMYDLVENLSKRGVQISEPISRLIMCLTAAVIRLDKTSGD